MQSFTPGWNDPPSLVRNDAGRSSLPSSNVRNLFQKRVAYPISGNCSPQMPPMENAVASGYPPLVPPTNLAPNDHPDNVVAPIHNGSTALLDKAPVYDAAAAPVDSVAPNSPSITNEEIQSVLRACLTSCGSIPAVTSDNISKRFEKLYQALTHNSLSPHCRQGLCDLVRAMKEARFTDAYNIHSAMMVNYFAEVNQWMIGVKALILECQKQNA